MNKRYISLLLICSLLFSAAFLSSCKKEEEDEPSGVSVGLKQQMDGDTDFDDPAYDNESDTAVLVTVPHDEEDFIGAWTATSEHAQWLYGNVNLKINENHHWTGNITNDDYSGRWTYTNEGVIIKDTEGVIHWKLYFVSDGSLMSEDMDDPGSPIVLKKGTGNAQ